MDQVEVKIPASQCLQRLPAHALDAFVDAHDLGGDEELLARHVRVLREPLLQRLARRLLILVELCFVEVPEARGEGRFDGGLEGTALALIE